MHASTMVCLLALVSCALLVPTQGTTQSLPTNVEFDEGEIDDQRDLEDEDDEDDEDRPSSFESFDEVRIERVSPGDIPDFQPGLPDDSPSQLRTEDLPRSLSGSELQRVTDHVASATVELIALSTPPAPFRPTPMVWRGHGLWLATEEDGTDPVLVTTADWLDEAEDVYAVVGDIGHALSEGGLDVGGHRRENLTEMQSDPQELIQRHRDQLAPLRVDQPNRHVNLTTLRPDGQPSVSPPTYGLLVHRMDSPMPDAIFGYSPALGRSLVPTGYSPIDDLDEAYSFYFPIHFQAILGAPVVGTHGRLLGITALRYPENPELTLTIPPGAITAYLKSIADD